MKTIKATRKNLEIKAAQLITRKIGEYLKTKDKVVLGIPGGTSVIGILELLKNQNIPWTKVHIFMVDERLVPTNHPESNFKFIYETFLEYLTKQKLLPLQNMHPFTYFNLSDRQAAKAYKNELREISHHYDIILLSSGEDGHVASLFPNHETIKNQSEFFIITNNSPKLPKARMSASRKLLQKSQTSLLLFFGASKIKAYNNFLNDNFSINDCPARLVKEIEDSYVFSDITI